MNKAVDRGKLDAAARDGLRERLAPLGATLTTSADVPSFRLTARFADPLQEIS